MSVGNIRSVSVGITANGRQLGEEAEIKAQMFSLAQKFNRNSNVQFSTSAQIAQNPCYMPFIFLGVNFKN